mmetsp:Transcript_28858/g.42519  ORF Transcript_28858/g.42519 Transcript_28858/m.42519 type:complete len:117 (+) Transcript_28858:29-379(+)
MEEDNTAMVSPSPTSIVPETIPELEGEVEQLVAAPTITDKKVAKTAGFIASLCSTPNGKQGASTNATWGVHENKKPAARQAPKYVAESVSQRYHGKDNKENAVLKRDECELLNLEL